MPYAANDDRAPALPAITSPVSPVRFHADPAATSIMLYWAITDDTQARAALRAVGAVAVGIDTQPAGPATRRIFGSSRVGRASVTFGAFARLVSAGYVEPILRA